MELIGSQENEYDQKDWSLFTSFILLESVSCCFVIESIDELVARGANEKQLKTLLNLRRTLAIYAPIYKHFKEEDER